MISGSEAAQSASGVNGCQRWAWSQLRRRSAETCGMGAFPDHSSLPPEPDGRPRPGGELLGGVAVDDGDLDRSRAADQGNHRPGGAIAVSPDEPVDACPGHLEGPVAGSRVAEPLTEEVRDQVAEGVAEDDLADESARMGGRLEVAERVEPGADRAERGGIATAHQVRGGRGED